MQKNNKSEKTCESRPPLPSLSRSHASQFTSRRSLHYQNNVFNCTVGQLVWVENNYQMNSTSYVNFEQTKTLFADDIVFLKAEFRPRAILWPFFGYFTPFRHVFRTKHASLSHAVTCNPNIQTLIRVKCRTVNCIFFSFQFLAPKATHGKEFQNIFHPLHSNCVFTAQVRG